MKKARTAADARELRDLPNIGPAMVGDFLVLGITRPDQLPGRDPHALYLRLCELTGVRHDPCVLDVFISAVRFMEGAPPHPWWHYTGAQKPLSGHIDWSPRAGTEETRRCAQRL